MKCNFRFCISSFFRCLENAATRARTRYSTESSLSAPLQSRGSSISSSSTPFFLLPFANLLLCQPEIVCPELFVSDLLWKYELHVTCRETVITLFHEVT